RLVTHSTADADRRVWDVTRTNETEPFEVLGEVVQSTRESVAVWTVLSSCMGELLQVLLDDYGAASRRIGAAHVVRIPDRQYGEFVIQLILAGNGVWHIASFVPATDPRWTLIRRLGSYSRSRLALWPRSTLGTTGPSSSLSDNAHAS